MSLQSKEQTAGKDVILRKQTMIDLISSTIQNSFLDQTSSCKQAKVEYICNGEDQRISGLVGCDIAIQIQIEHTCKRNFTNANYTWNNASLFL
jgi:L-asparaginase II